MNEENIKKILTNLVKLGEREVNTNVLTAELKQILAETWPLEFGSYLGSKDDIVFAGHKLVKTCFHSDGEIKIQYHLPPEVRSRTDLPYFCLAEHPSNKGEGSWWTAHLEGSAEISTLVCGTPEEALENLMFKCQKTSLMLKKFQGFVGW